MFSVIIPIYNIENYIRKCLDSVVSQTFSDLEIILVDDGSTDNCPIICDEYAAMDKRIHVIHKKNGGLVSARKAGAKLANSDYIACVDGDDWIEKDYFEKFHSIVKKHSPDIVGCGFIIQDKNGDSRLNPICESCGFYSKKDIEEKIFPHIIGFSNNLWGKVFKRELYLDIQLSVDDRINIGEDACVVVITIILIINSHKYYNLDISRFFIMSIIMANLIMCILVYFSRMINVGVVTGLIVSVLIGVVSYSFFLFVLRNDTALMLFNLLTTRVRKRNNMKG